VFLNKIIGENMSNKKFKIPNITRNNPELAAVISKLNTSEDERFNIADALTGDMPDISNGIKDKLVNNENIVQLFPDVDLSIQIIVSSILSPNDLMTTSLNYSSPEINIPSSLKSLLLEEIKDSFSKNVDIKTKLPTIVRESLFTKGAYIEAIIPESNLDLAITGTGEVSVENYLDSKYLSDNNVKLSPNGISDFTISLEDYGIGNGNIKLVSSNEKLDLGFEIIDDPSIMVAKDKIIDGMVNSVSNTTLSNEDSDKIKQMDNIFRTTFEDEEPFISMENTVRSNIGKPLIQKIPVEATIPVHVSGDTSKHIGYFILLDENGSPITTIDKPLNGDEEVTNMFTGESKDNKLNIINKATTALTGITKTVPKLKDMEKIYSAVITKQIKQSLANGNFKSIAEVNDDSDIYRIMFSRALKSKKTRVLYIPSNMINYYAFDYRDNGTGLSMLEKVSMLFSIRAIILFTRLMANIKNSITTTEVSATLSENDINPTKTMEKIISETMKTRQTYLPLGLSKIEDLVDWTHKVGFKYNFKHPGLPDMDISTSDENTSKVIPDDELDDMIQEHIIMSFGLTPEMVKSGYESDFATTIISNNILLSKRIMQYQDKLAPMISKHVRTYINADANLQNRLSSIIKNNMASITKRFKKDTKDNINIPKDADISDYIINSYINEMTITLPQPAVQETENMKDAFEKYLGSLDDYLEIVISEDALPEEFTGDISSKMDDLKSIIKTVLSRKWMSDNGYLNEINEFLTTDEDGKPVFNILDEYNLHIDKLSAALIPFLKVNKKITNKYDDKLDNIDNDDDDDDSDTVNDDTSGDEPVDNNTDDTSDDDGSDETTGDEPADDGTDDTSGDELQ